MLSRHGLQFVPLRIKKNVVLRIDTRSSSYVVKLFWKYQRWNREACLYRTAGTPIVGPPPFIRPLLIETQIPIIGLPFIVSHRLKDLLTGREPLCKKRDLIRHVLDVLALFHSFVPPQGIPVDPSDGTEEAYKNIVYVFGDHLETVHSMFRSWGVERLFQSWLAGDGFVPPSSLCLRHGDLASGNILVPIDENLPILLIDFEHTAVGSRAHDYGSLLFSLISDLRPGTERAMVVDQILAHAGLELIPEIPFYVASRALCTSFHYFRHSESAKVRWALKLSEELLQAHFDLESLQRFLNNTAW